jgi:hypothetical protein
VQLKFTSPDTKQHQAENARQRLVSATTGTIPVIGEATEPGQNLKEGGEPISEEAEEPVPKSDLYTNPAIEALIKRDTDADDVVCDEKLNMLSFEHLLELSERIRVSVTMILRPHALIVVCDCAEVWVPSDVVSCHFYRSLSALAAREVSSLRRSRPTSRGPRTCAPSQSTHWRCATEESSSHSLGATTGNTGRSTACVGTPNGMTRTRYVQFT